jgi:hypothetical protein
MTGDASVAIVSGKKRYIFDFHSTVVYDIRDRDTEEVIASGSFKLPDICSTHHVELEVLVEGWKKSPSENATVAKECRDTTGKGALLNLNHSFTLANEVQPTPIT